MYHVDHHNSYHHHSPLVEALYECVERRGQKLIIIKILIQKIP